jgi:hypothetical protein
MNKSAVSPPFELDVVEHHRAVRVTITWRSGYQASELDPSGIPALIVRVCETVSDHLKRHTGHGVEHKTALCGCSACVKLSGQEGGDG